MNDDRVKLSRRQLYKEIWETPIRRLSVKYRLSDVGLAKVCKRMDIPRPPRGYWRRTETGQKVQKTPLPPANKDTHLEVELGARKAAPPKAKVTPKRRDPIVPLVLKETLTDPHPLVATTLRRYESAKVDRYGVLAVKAKRVLHLSVSSENLDRCLRLMNALLKSWEAEGLEIKLLQVGPHSDPETVLCWGDEHVSLSITEKVEEFDPGPTEDEKLKPKWTWKKRTTYRPTGKLTFSMRGDYISNQGRFKRHCRDSPTQPLEAKARRIWEAGMDYFEKRREHAAEEAQRIAAEQERRRQREIEAEQEQADQERREEERRRQEEERLRCENLVKDAAEWAKSRQVQAFIVACEKYMADNSVDAEEIDQWTEWARSVADEIDPLKDGYPTIPPFRGD